MSQHSWLLLVFGIGFVVASFVQMALGSWLGAYRLDAAGKRSGGIDTSLGGMSAQLSASNYSPAAHRWLPILQVTFVLRIVLFLGAMFLWLSGT